MAAEVLNSSSVLRLNFCAKLNFCASISATSPSRKTLCDILKTMPKNKIHRLNQRNMDKTLDDLLNYLKTTLFLEEQDYIQYLNALDIFFFCYGDKLNDIHNYTEPKLFLDKLYKDGFVNFESLENTYQINLNGVEFINNGGYQKRYTINNQKKYWEIIKIIAITINALLLLIFANYASKLI